MPVYDYGCASCGTVREVQHAISEIGKITVTCDCGNTMVKQLSTPALIGFDNVGRSVSKKTETATAESAKPASCEGCACNAA